MQSAELIEWVDDFYEEYCMEHIHPAVWFAFMLVS